MLGRGSIIFVSCLEGVGIDWLIPGSCLDSRDSILSDPKEWSFEAATGKGVHLCIARRSSPGAVLTSATHTRLFAPLAIGVVEYGSLLRRPLSCLVVRTSSELLASNSRSARSRLI